MNVVGVDQLDAVIGDVRHTLLDFLRPLALPFRSESFVDEALVKLVCKLLPLLSRERQQLASDFGADRHHPKCTRYRDWTTASHPRLYVLVATVVHGDFEWDDGKAESNLAKHGVSFEEAAWAMKGPLSLDFDDLVEPDNLITLAVWPAGRILYMVSTVQDDRIRIISGYDATTHERRRCEEAG